MRPWTGCFGVAVALLLACRLGAQDRFEVASIKPVVPNVMHMVGAKVYPGGRVVITTMPLKSLILRTPSGAFDCRQTTRLADNEVNYRDPSEYFVLSIRELGLKLERTKGPVEVFVIDSAARSSAN